MHLTFAADELPGRYRDVAASVGLLEKWYKFEEAALDSATRVFATRTTFRLWRHQTGHRSDPEGRDR
jgi:hypothetical protein